MAAPLRRRVFFERRRFAAAITASGAFWRGDCCANGCGAYHAFGTSYLYFSGSAWRAVLNATFCRAYSISDNAHVPKAISRSSDVSNNLAISEFAAGVAFAA